MNAKRQNDVIALECGWTVGVNVYGNQYLKCPKGHKCPPYDGDGYEAIYCTPPDYLNDLNAMHEAVELLRIRKGPEWFDFQKHLMDICGSLMNCIQANAAIRAEAFLKTLGLWEEE